MCFNKTGMQWQVAIVDLSFFAQETPDRCPSVGVLRLGAEAMDCMLLVLWQSLQHWLQLGSMLGCELLHNASDTAPDL